MSENENSNEKIMIIDEDGNEYEADCLDYFKVDDQEYIVLAILDDVEELSGEGIEDDIIDVEVDTEDLEVEDGINKMEASDDIGDVEEITIMKVIKNDDEYIYERIDDEDEFVRALDEFKSRCEGEYELLED